MAFITFYETGEQVKIDVKKDLKYATFGGQSRIYYWTYKRKHYVIKAIPDPSEIFRRIKDLRLRLKEKSKGERIPHGIFYRGLPVGQGRGLPQEFGFKTVKNVGLLVFRKVYGNNLMSYLKNEEPLSKRRRAMARMALDILIYMQDCGIVHGDLYPDNFMVDDLKNRVNPNLYIIDFEGAGILNTRRTAWYWQPTVLGKEYMFPNPPEVKETGVPSFYSDRWIGVYLIFYILAGFKQLKHPIPFLIRIDHKVLNAMYLAADKKVACWPPKLPSSFRYISRHYPPEKFAKFMKYYFSGTRFEWILFKTYIAGYKDPQKRPDFREVKYCLRGVL